MRLVPLAIALGQRFLATSLGACGELAGGLPSKGERLGPKAVRRSRGPSAAQPCALSLPMAQPAAWG